jgi:6-phosphogluconolactonase
MKTVYKNDRRELIVPGTEEESIQYSVEQFIELANKAISERSLFTVALSGGTTPKAIFELLSHPSNASKIDWAKVKIFWSDERAVAPTDPDSNYHMAMQAGLKDLPINPDNIFRMKAEKDPQKNAQAYSALIEKNVPECRFDLIMLGMGSDGHTASLFPHTDALSIISELTFAYEVPQTESTRMTLTFPAINNARNIVVYVIGSSKAPMLKKVLAGPHHPHHYPAQNVGTLTNPSLWIADEAAAGKFS